MTETAFCYVDSDELAHFSTNERRYITKIMRLVSTHPEDVRIIAMPENNGGYLTIDVPKNWLRVAAPRTRDMTDEQREESRQRMINYHKTKG